jgi:site-specific DNA-methyltransferase (adenine-specific)
VPFLSKYIRYMELFNANCFDIFPKIGDKTIDLFVLDLPYANFKFGKCTACKWDVPIDLDKMWIEIKRIMKPNAVIVFFCNTKFGYALIESNPKWFKYDLIFKKGNRKVGFLSANKQPLRQHENIYIFKEKQGTYNPQKIEGKPYKNGEDKNPNNVYGITKEKGTTIKTDRHPSSILPDDLETTILDYNTPHRTIHRTQKPEKLLEWLIKTYSNEEDTVMDFCMGSGTAGVACINTNRKFIGVEMDKEIFELAKKRIENHIP